MLHLIYLKPKELAHCLPIRLGTVLHLIYLKPPGTHCLTHTGLGTVLHLIYLKPYPGIQSYNHLFGYCVTFDISQTTRIIITRTLPVWVLCYI